MSNGSVGVISLDLIIKEKLGEQLEKIKSTVRSPAEKVGEAIRTSIEEPIKNVGKAAAKTVSEAVKNVGESVNDDVDNAIKRLLEREEEQRKALFDAANSITQKVSESSGNYMKYNTDEIIKSADKFSDAIGKPIKKTVEKANEDLAELGRFEVSSDPIERLRQEINITGTQMSLLQKKWQQLSSIEPTNEITAQIAATEQKIISAQNKIDKLRSSLTKLSEPSGVDPADKQKQIFEEKIMSIREKNAAKVRQIEEQNAAKITQLNARTAALKEKYDSRITILKEQNSARITAIEEQNAARIAAVKEQNAAKIAAIEEQNAAKIQKITEKTASKNKSTIKSSFGKIKSVGSKALGTIGKAAGSIGAKLKGLGKSAANVTKPISKLGNSLKRAFKSVFLMAGVYAVFRALKNGLAEAAKADDEFSKSLNAVKANLSIAFTPILQAIMPALNTLMSGLASVTRSVAGFIAGLFGTTYKQAAEATKKLKGVADTAKKAKLSTAGIDEMNILSDGGSDSSDRSEKQGVDYSNIDMSEPELPDWTQRLKDSIRSGDWTGVGSILAERVNSVLGSVNWDKIQSKVNSGVTKITDLINGFLDNVNWETLGDTLAGGLNTITGAINTFYSKVKWDKLGSGIARGLNQAIKKTNWKQLGKAFSGHIQAVIDTAYSFVTTFDWSGFGNALGTAVNGWFDGIDFGKAGKTISEGIKGLLDTAINVVQTINWRQIGSKIAEFIGNIDFSGIARRYYELFGSALGAAVSFIWGALENVVKSIGEYFSGKIDECGGNVALGLLKGIADGFISIGKWIKDNIFKPFIDGFKKAFGIHSPSREMAVMGGYIIDGLFNAISDGIDKIRGIFSKMLETIKKVFSGIGGWFSDRWNDIKKAFSAAGTWFGNVFQTAWNNIKAVFSKPGEFFSKVWESIKSCFKNVKGWFKEKFSAAWKGIKDIFSGVGSWFSGRWNDIKKAFSAVGSWFGKTFSGAWTKIKEAFSGVGKFFGDMWSNIKENFTDLGKKIGDSVGGAFKSVINGVLATIEDIINGGIDMINGAIKFINKIPGVDIGKIGTLELPRLANGGLASAPTLAMVGDNKNASVDPEVIAPLSKLQGMLGSDNSEIVELLKVIIQLLKGGLSAEIIGSIFGSDFKRAVLKICADDKARRFG